MASFTTVNGSFLYKKGDILFGFGDSGRKLQCPLSAERPQFTLFSFIVTYPPRKGLNSSYSVSCLGNPGTGSWHQQQYNTCHRSRDDDQSDV